MLFTLIKNELIKIFKRGKTWVIFILFGIMIFGLTFVFKSNSNLMEFYNSAEGQIESYQESLEYEKEWLEQIKADGSAADILSAEENIKFYQEQIEQLKKVVDNKDNPDYWKEELKLEKENCLEYINDETIPESSKTYEKQRVEEIDMYLDKDIKPIEDWEFDAVNFGLQFMEIVGMIILGCGIALFMSDIVSGECTPPTLKFLLVQPISRGKVLLSKFISVVITVIGLIAGLEILVFGILAPIAGVKAWDMPQVIGTKYQWDYSTVATQGSPSLEAVANSGHYVTRGEFLLQSFAMQILFIIACCAFVFLISCIFKSSMITMAISVVCTVAVNILCEMSSTIAKVAHLLFFSYSSPTQVIDGSIVYMYQNTNFSVVTGIIVMVVTTIVCYLIGTFVFKKKDILI